ncbi:MAG: glycosyltransferase family 2 protein [Anaerolineae bacterium]|nr:glycosyltransferase family 2 protein [Anaerolineae bacterium]
MSIFNKSVSVSKNQPLPKIAMFMCIHNEERFLEANLRYHRALGVSRAYVFLDRCEDASLQIAQSFPWVEPIILDDRLHTLSPYYSDLFRVCADHAWRMAQAEGFDWLVCIDVDEFVFVNNQSIVQNTHFDLTDIPLETILCAGHLPSMLSTVSPGTEAIFLQSWNVVPGKPNQNDPFWKQYFFQSQKPWTQTMCDPLTGKIIDWDGNLASRGKSMVRTNAAIQCLDSHLWVRSQGVNHRPVNISIPTKNHGFLYHFYIVNSHHWREKYQKLSRELTLWQSGSPVQFPKQCGKRASAVLNNDEIEIYLNEWFFLPAKVLESHVEQQLLRKADVVEKVITGVDLSELENDQPNHLAIDQILTEFRVTEQQIIASKSENGVIASPKTKLTPTPSHRRKNSVALPPVSCICLPQGQPERLEEAIYSFLQQDYQGQKELVILNDNADQLLEIDHPEIRIVNLSEQFFAPNQKRNAAIALCAHDLIFVWDDDGIYLPHCISFSIEKFRKRKGFFKPTKVFVLSNGALRLPRQNIFHSGSCLTRKWFDKVRGYTSNQKLYFYKEEIETQFKRKYPNLVQFYDIAIEDIFYIYRWGGVQIFQKNGATKSDEIKHGPIKLTPHWQTDYLKLVRDYLISLADVTDN